MRKRSLFLFSALVLLIACGEDGPRGKANAKGGRHFGGIFNWNEGTPLRSIHPLGLTTASAYRIGSLVFQGLVALDPTDLSIKPCLAESWEVDAGRTVYTMHLRRDVRFQPDTLFPDGEGRLMTARDVEQCFKQLCTASPQNQMFWLFQDRVRGADRYYAATAKGEDPGALEGVKVVDEHTLRIELTAPEPVFLQVLAHQGCWIYPPELMAASPATTMRAIGTGPFMLRTVSEGGALVFERSPLYWERDTFGNALPFLDGVRVTFKDDRSGAFDAFLKGHLSMMVDPPLARFEELRDSLLPGTGALRFHLEYIPGLSVQFYGFNALRPPFDDPRVRRAFALAIDRRYLVDSVLKGVAVPAEHGVVPPGMKGYPRERVHGASHDPDKARRLLAEAGFPGGRGFPPIRLQVSNDGFGFVSVAEAVQVMLQRDLGIGLSVSVMPPDQHYEMVDGGRALFWRQGWVADYPDPENFLALFYGRNAELDTLLPSVLNTTRYHNARFDSLFTAARSAADPQVRLNTLALAEQQAMDDVTITPLYFERTVRLLQPWVKDMPVNAMEIRDLARVWFDPALRGH